MTTVIGRTAFPQRSPVSICRLTVSLKCLFVSIGLLIPLPVSAAPFFHGLGFLSGGSPFSNAYGVSADGTAVVGQGQTPGGGQAFRWTAANGMQPIPGFLATAVSADGSVVVGQTSSTGPEALRWTLSGGSKKLGGLPGLGPYGYANSVSGNGSVVVGSASSPYRPFRWTAATGTTGLGFLAGDSDGEALGISADGSVIVGYSGIRNAEAVRWTSAGVTPLGRLNPNYYSLATAASQDGSVIVGEGISSVAGWGVEAFRWTSMSGMTGLGVLPGYDSSNAYAITPDGSVIVGKSSRQRSNQLDSATIWDQVNGMRDVNLVLSDLGVNLNGWKLTAATGISADGLTIVGTGINPSGNTEAWMAQIPEPCSALMLMAGCMLRPWRYRDVEVSRV